MNAKRWIAAIALAAIGLPLCIYVIAQRVQPLLPRSDPRLLTAAQFEKAFNERMAEHGLSVDLSASYTYSGARAYKTAEIQTQDGSTLVCRVMAENYRGNAIVSEIAIEQALSGEAGETVYLRPLTEALLCIFKPPMAADRTLEKGYCVSFNDVMDGCGELLAGRIDAYDAYICSHILSAEKVEHIDSIRLTHTTDEQEALLVRIQIGFYVA